MGEKMLDVLIITTIWLIILSLCYALGETHHSSSSSLPSSFQPTTINSKSWRKLKMLTKDIQAEIIVAPDGTGTVKTITEAINRAPDHSPRPFIIKIRAGTYSEGRVIVVPESKTNIWMLGEGIDLTIITGNKSVVPGLSTSNTATFAVMGIGFLARGISFINEAGPEKAQAVALRVDGDNSVFFRCAMKGYQDTLYVRSGEQFYRECHVYGTTDFIFGQQANAVFQNCTIWGRKPTIGKPVVITAQGRAFSFETSGISFQACSILATPELEAEKASFPTYLGRPWKNASRVVYMESYIGDHVHVSGWLPWQQLPPSKEIFYGEYRNFGPGANTSKRVKWNGVHVNMTFQEANKFSVDMFIDGGVWLPGTKVPYKGGL